MELRTEACFDLYNERVLGHIGTGYCIDIPHHSGVLELFMYSMCISVGPTNILLRVRDVLGMKPPFPDIFSPNF